MYRRKNFKSKWIKPLAVIILLNICSLVFTDPNTVSAQVFTMCANFTNCWAGHYYNQINYGSDAHIGTASIPNPNDGGVSTSFMLILSAGVVNGQDSFIQTGWAVGYNGGCGNRPTVITEYMNFNIGGNPQQRCNFGIYPAIGTDHVYTNEYNDVTLFWAHLYDGRVLQQESSATTRFSVAAQVAAYGESNDRNIQVGGPNQGAPVLLYALKYKPLGHGGFNYIFHPPAPTGAWGSCDPAPCPYGTQNGESAGIWWVSVWKW
jgi:hypothetical protein